MTPVTCAACDLDLHHCHAVLVEHDDGTVTCLEGCGGPRTVHDLVLACAEVELGCCEAPPRTLEPAEPFSPREPAWAA